MIAGVNFDPAQQGQDKAPSPEGGVQEAIKVLSLRLPKVVGARAIAPQALLSSPGGGGRVESVVNQVLSRYFPTGQPAQMPTATMPAPQTSQAPSLQGWMPQPAYGQPKTPAAPPTFTPSVGQAPNITFENPAPPNMNPPEWKTPPPPPPPGWNGHLPAFPSQPSLPTFDSPFQMPEL